jgi:hypothetical protein
MEHVSRCESSRLIGCLGRRASTEASAVEVLSVEDDAFRGGNTAGTRDPGVLGRDAVATGRRVGEELGGSQPTVTR